MIQWKANQNKIKNQESVMSWKPHEERVSLPSSCRLTIGFSNVEVTEVIEWDHFSSVMRQSLIGMSLRKKGRELEDSNYQQLLKEFCFKGEQINGDDGYGGRGKDVLWNMGGIKDDFISSLKDVKKSIQERKERITCLWVGGKGWYLVNLWKN